MINAQDVLKEVMGLIASGASMERVLLKAEEAKLKLSAAWGEMQQALVMLDTTMATFAPGSDWPIGWVTPDWQMPPAGKSKAKAVAPKALRPIPTSKQSIIDIATRMVADGNATVTTKAIAERLQSQGDQRPLKDIGTAVGNVLAKSGTWRKVGIGEYAPLSG